MAFFFSREGPVEEFGGAEELAEAPEAIEMPFVLWHVAGCTGAEDFIGKKTKPACRDKFLSKEQ